MIDTINNAWKWTGVVAEDIFSSNDFGNIIFKATDGSWWRICPEELRCTPIAKDRPELNQLLANPEFSEDWQMYELTEAARKHLGYLEPGEKYCLKLPAALGGLYEPSNYGKISHEKLIYFSGEMALRIKDLPDDEKLKLILG